MQIIGSDKPEFFVAAAVIRSYLPDVEIGPNSKIITADGRYYGLVNAGGGTVMYDHVIVDKTMCNPEFIFMAMTTLFTFGDIINVFIDVKNEKSEKFTRGIGFIKTGILRNPHKDVVIYSMNRTEWLNNKIRQHFIAHSAQ